MLVAVSGSSRGIGRAIAERFLAEGHEVVGFDISAPTIEHPAFRHVTCDIREELPAEAVCDPEALVCCAGTQDDEAAIAVNLEGTIRFAEALTGGPSLRSVLFIASASARTGAEFPRYAASKAGLVGYMKNLALSLAPRGVTVNSISPGGVNTESNAHILESEELHRAVLAETLLGKWAEPEEVAELAYYLCARNRSITGEDILMDNGEMLKSNFIW